MRWQINDRLADLALDNLVDISPLVMQRHTWHARQTLFTVNVNNEGIKL